MKELAKIGPKLAGDRNLVLISDGTRDRVQIYDKAQKKLICKHVHSYKELSNWISEHDYQRELCPSCNNTSGYPKIRYNGPGEDESMDSLTSDGEGSVMSESYEYHDDEQLPEWFVDGIWPTAKSVISQHYRPTKTYDDSFVGPVPENTNLEVLHSTAKDFNNNRTLNFGKGVFANRTIEKGEWIGEYRGTVIFDMEDVRLSKSTKLLGLSIMEREFAVDAGNYWAGFINHKWNWPYKEKELPDAYLPYFSNVLVSPQGKLTALRTIKEGEELSFDYGLNYWGDLSPFWVISYGRISESGQQGAEDFLIHDKECFILLLASEPVNYSSQFPEKVKKAAKKYGLLKELLNSSMWNKVTSRAD